MTAQDDRRAEFVETLRRCQLQRGEELALVVNQQTLYATFTSGGAELIHRLDLRYVDTTTDLPQAAEHLLADLRRQLAERRGGNPQVVLS